MAGGGGGGVWRLGEKMREGELRVLEMKEGRGELRDLGMKGGRGWGVERK